jgi:hypothetical protein
MANSLQSLGTLAAVGIVGWAFVTHKPAAQTTAPKAQAAQVAPKAVAPKYVPPAMPSSATELPPSVVPEILKRVARSEQDAKPKFDARGRQIIDLTPIPMVPQANSKTDILGFYIAMPKGEVVARFQEIGCRPRKEESTATYVLKYECEFAGKEQLTIHLVKGLVGDQETEVVKAVELIFNSNEGALQTVDTVSRQFRSLPVFFGDDMVVRRIKYCTPGLRHEYACNQGDLARWPLTKQIELDLTLSSVADDERKKPDSYWLRMTFSPLEDMEAEKAYKRASAQKRVVTPSPRF